MLHENLKIQKKTNAHCLRHKKFIEWISYLYYIQLINAYQESAKFIHLHVLFNHAEKRLVFVPAFLIDRLSSSLLQEFQGYLSILD